MQRPSARHRAPSSRYSPAGIADTGIDPVPVMTEAIRRLSHFCRKRSAVGKPARGAQRRAGRRLRLPHHHRDTRHHRQACAVRQGPETSTRSRPSRCFTMTPAPPVTNSSERSDVTGPKRAADDFGHRSGLRRRDQHSAVPGAHGSGARTHRHLRDHLRPRSLTGSIPNLSSAMKSRVNRNIGLMVFSRRFGQPAATMAGILNCRGRWCAIIDVDLQDPPEAIEAAVAQGAGRFRRCDGAPRDPRRRDRR